MSLTTLPSLPMEAIISYLDFSSIVSLANSHPCLAHLQPKEQFVVGKDFSIGGHGGCMPMPHFPEGVGIGMCNEMNGSDSSEGQIWLQLVRNGEVLEKFEYTSLAHGGKVYRWQDE